MTRDGSGNCTDKIASLLYGLWGLQSTYGLFRYANRDWPWILYIRHSNAAEREVTIGEIGGILGVSYPTARKVVRSIEDLGYIEVTKDEFDKRKAIVRFTDKGLAEMSAYEEKAAQFIDGLVSGTPAMEPYAGR